MAPASASPQPPSGRSDEARHGRQEPEGARRGEQDQGRNAQERCTVYGPLSVERHLEQDGRALILYARRESQER
ncbi:MAG TPA: hypothetical protein VK730_11460 [Solirubrobacteraceae bacterium]|nr:hypothetical protein [Solirubrobacteraceae bacterium]